MSKLRLVIVGGGAISEAVYLPILASENDFEVHGLVESNEQRAAYLKQRFQISRLFASVDHIVEPYDAVLIAVPNYLHKEIAIHFLNLQKHVLVEKPMAILSKDCAAMIKASHANAKLMVAMVRRYYDNINQVKELISRNALGKLQRIQVEEGYEFNWPMVSDSLINKMKSGGGVLIDVGVHVLDTLYYWLGKPNAFDYYDDSALAIEAECRLSMRWPTGVEALINLSRLRKLNNTIILSFEFGSVIVDIRPTEKVKMVFRDNVSIEGNFLLNSAPDKLGPFKKQLKEFAAYIRNNAEPLTSTIDAQEVMELIQNCYQTKKSIFSHYTHF